MVTVAQIGLRLIKQALAVWAPGHAPDQDQIRPLKTAQRKLSGGDVPRWAPVALLAGVVAVLALGETDVSSIAICC